MLERTFLHLSGIDAARERQLWALGVRTWHDLRDALHDVDLGEADKVKVRDELEESEGSLAGGVFQFFAPRLGGSEAWRAFPEFRSQTVYLDIETDGGNSGTAITMVGLYDGAEFRCLVRDRDLGCFPDVISHYGLITTFFGAGFDIPMLRKRFRSWVPDQIHLDLCPTLRRVGLRGGLKAIEKQLDIARGDDTDGLGGLDAIRLWNRFRMLHDESSLNLLIAYNREDVVNLERLSEIAYARLVSSLFPDEVEKS